MNQPITPSDFRSYLDWTTTQLLERLALVQGTIAELVRLHTEAKSSELDARAQGWAMSQESTVRGREKSSQFNASGAIQARLETEGHLEALREEKEFLTFVISMKTRVLTDA